MISHFTPGNRAFQNSYIYHLSLDYFVQFVRLNSISSYFNTFEGAILTKERAETWKCKYGKDPIKIDETGKIEKSGETTAKALRMFYTSPALVFAYNTVCYTEL